MTKDLWVTLLDSVRNLAVKDSLKVIVQYYERLIRMPQKRIARQFFQVEPTGRENSSKPTTKWLGNVKESAHTTLLEKADRENGRMEGGVLHHLR